jgi:hypothetical protein
MKGLIFGKKFWNELNKKFNEKDIEDKKEL